MIYVWRENIVYTGFGTIYKFRYSLGVLQYVPPIKGDCPMCHSCTVVRRAGGAEGKGIWWDETEGAVWWGGCLFEAYVGGPGALEGDMPCCSGWIPGEAPLLLILGPGWFFSFSLLGWCTLAELIQESWYENQGNVMCRLSDLTVESRTQMWENNCHISVRFLSSNCFETHFSNML